LSAPRAWVEVDLSAIDNNSNRWTYKDTPRENIHVRLIYHLYGQGNFKVICKINQPFTPVSEGETTRVHELSHLGLGRVTLVSGTAFLHKNALARLTAGTNVCVGSVTNILDLGLKAEIRIKNELGKTHCDRLTEGNSKKEGYLYI